MYAFSYGALLGFLLGLLTGYHALRLDPTSAFSRSVSIYMFVYAVWSRQALSWGATVQAQREAEDGLSFTSSYTLAFSRYQLSPTAPGYGGTPMCGTCSRTVWSCDTRLVT